MRSQSNLIKTQYKVFYKFDIPSRGYSELAKIFKSFFFGPFLVGLLYIFKVYSFRVFILLIKDLKR